MGRIKRRLHGFQINEIREGANEGKTFATLANKYGCSKSLIEKIISHEVYSNHPGVGEHDEMYVYFTGSHYYEPEKCLIEAMLLSARKDIIDYPKTEYSDSAINWILSKNDGEFSFTNVTEYLGLNTDLTKKAILKRATEDQFERAKKRLELDVERDMVKRKENMQLDVIFDGE